MKESKYGRRIQRTKGIIGIISRGLLTGEFVQEDMSSKLADDLREGSEQGLNQLIGEWTKWPFYTLQVKDSAVKGKLK